MKNIEVSETAYARLLELGGGLFSLSEVVDRLLARGPLPTIQVTTARPPSAHDPATGQLHRSPRERGISIMFGDLRIDAVSVRDLFDKVLRWLVDEGGIKRVDAVLPLRTSNKRYLLARKPVHPGGNDFVVPVTYKGYSMEAHKNYENALSGLRQVAKLGGFSLRVIA
jgi:hypothetical protein